MKKTENINFKIDVDLKKALDEIAYEQDSNTSEVIRLALKVYVFLKRENKFEYIISLLLDDMLKPSLGGAK